MTTLLKPTASAEWAYGRQLGRAFGGALVFVLPLLMTMEMWALGFSMDRGRLLILLGAALPLLYALSHFAGFSRDGSPLTNLLDTAAALAIGFITAAAALLLFGAVTVETTPPDAIGQIAIQAIGGAIGALLARRQLSDRSDEADEELPNGKDASYLGELFLMAIGALFLALNLAPTEEMILIGYMASPCHALAILVASLVFLHAIVFTAGFAGQEEQDRPLLAFCHFTLPGYAIALGISLFTLWVFERTVGEDIAGVLNAAVVLALPASVGAAAARLIV